MIKWRLLLAAACVALALLAPAPPARAGLIPRHTIVGQIFHSLPPVRLVDTFEERRDAYRAADAWLRSAQASAA